MRLVNISDVEDIVEKVTNEAIEKRRHKGTIQKSIMYYLSALKSVEATEEQFIELLDSKVELED